MSDALLNTLIIEWSSVKAFFLGSFITGFTLWKLSVIRRPTTKVIHEFKAKGEL